MSLLLTDVTVGDLHGCAVQVADGRIAWMGPAAGAPPAARVVAGEGALLTPAFVDAQGAEHGAVLATRDGGTVVFFSMATSFSAAALGAEGMAADMTMLVGNGYTPGHAALTLDLYRRTPGVRALIDPRVHA